MTSSTPVSLKPLSRGSNRASRDQIHRERLLAWAAGEPIRTIAQRYGVRREAIHYSLRHCLARLPSSERTKLRAQRSERLQRIAMQSEGVKHFHATVGMIPDRAGAKRRGRKKKSEVQHRLVRLDRISPLPGPVEPEMQQLLNARFQAFALGMSYQEIADAESSHRTTIRRSVRLCLSQLPTGERLELLRVRMGARAHLVLEDAYIQALGDLLRGGSAAQFATVIPAFVPAGMG